MSDTTDTDDTTTAHLAGDTATDDTDKLDLAPHPIVDKLVKDPVRPPTFVTVEGFLGVSSEGRDYVRLYTDEELSRWYDIPRLMIRHAEKLPESASRLGASLLWLFRAPPTQNGNPGRLDGRFP